MSALTSRIDRLERNLILNGSFDFWQRGNNNMLSNAYSADRFYVHNQNSTSTVLTTRSTLVPSTKSFYSMRTFINANAQASLNAAANIAPRYLVEGYDIAEAQGAPLVLQFWVKSNKIGTYHVACFNAGVNASLVIPYTINVANVWEFKSVSITALDTTIGTWDFRNGIGLNIQWTLGAGSTNVTALTNSWISGFKTATSAQVNFCDTVANEFFLGQVMLSVGTNIPNFTRAGRSISDELAMCQRYYEKSYNLESVPGGSGDFLGATQYIAPRTNTTSQNTTDRFKATKRAAPSVVLWSPTTGNNGRVRATSGGADVVATGVNIGDSGFTAQFDIGDATIYAWQWTADAEF